MPLRPRYVECANGFLVTPLVRSTWRALSISPSESVLEVIAQTNFNRTVRRAAVAAEHGDLKVLFQIVKRLMPRSPAPLPIVLLEDGSTAKTPLEASERWARYFSELFDAVRVPFGSFVRRHCDRLMLRPLPPAEGFLNVVNVPSLPSVVSLSAARKLGAGVGGDKLCADIMKLVPEEFGRAWHPLFCKSALVAKEPAQWLGGTIAVFPKGGGDARECSRNRAIVLGSDPGKLFHKSLRKLAAVPLSTHVFPNQFGGVAGRGVDFGAHVIREVQR